MWNRFDIQWYLSNKIYKSLAWFPYFHLFVQYLPCMHTYRNNVDRELKQISKVHVEILRWPRRLGGKNAKLVQGFQMKSLDGKRNHYWHSTTRIQILVYPLMWIALWPPLIQSKQLFYMKYAIGTGSVPEQCQRIGYIPSVGFLVEPLLKLPLLIGRFQPRQLLHKLSGSELQLHNESSSKRSESSKLKRSHSSFHSAGTTSCGGCGGCCAAAGAAAAGTDGPPPTASPTFASSSTYP